MPYGTSRSRLLGKKRPDFSGQIESDEMGEGMGKRYLLVIQFLAIIICCRKYAIVKSYCQAFVYRNRNEHELFHDVSRCAGPLRGAERGRFIAPATRFAPLARGIPALRREMLERSRSQASREVRSCSRGGAETRSVTAHAKTRRREENLRLNRGPRDTPRA